MPRREDSPKLVCVFQSYDEGHLAIAQSMLADENIDFLVSSQYMQDMLGYGRTGYNQLAVPRIMVSSTDAPAAQELLKDIIKDDTEPKFTNGNASRIVKAFRWFVIIWLITIPLVSSILWHIHFWQIPKR
jgi:hypothetical protein